MRKAGVVDDDNDDGTRSEDQFRDTRLSHT